MKKQPVEGRPVKRFRTAEEEPSVACPSDSTGVASQLARNVEEPRNDLTHNVDNNFWRKAFVTFGTNVVKKVRLCKKK